MSADDPHAPTPAGPDPDEKTEVHAAADPFSPGSEAAAEAGERAAEDTPEGAIGGTPEPAPTALPTPTVAPAAATEGAPAGSAQPAAPAPDPVFSTPDSFTPLGTPESEPSKVEAMTEQAQALTDKPEVQVGLAFVGGAVVSLILKRFGR